MNGRRTLLCMALFASLLSLRNSFAATLPQTIRQTTNGLAAAPSVQLLIDAQVPKLASNDPAAQQVARDAIVAEVLGTGATQQPSAVFLDVYASSLNNALIPLAKSQDARVRLNAAIVAARVAEHCSNAKLVPVTVDLLNDSSEAVVFWALRGSRYVMVPALSGLGAKTNPLLPAFVAAAKKYIKSGPMTQAAYESLKVPQGSAVQPSVVQPLVDAVHALLRLRLDQYGDGLPDMASVETSATGFLVDEKIWRAQTPAQQLLSIQLMYNLSNLAASRISDASLPEKQELTQILKREASGFTVVGQWIKNPAIEPAARQLSIVSANTPQQDAVTRVRAMYPVLHAIPAFRELKDAPTTQP